MINYIRIIVKLIFGILIVFIFQSCKEHKTKTIKVDKVTIDSISETEIKKVIDDLYEVYTKSDLKWVDFYKDEYRLVSDDGTVKLKHSDSLRIEWEDIYKRYDVILNERGKPILSVSGTQVFHYNTFDEIFINKATNDTIKNIGTWIVLWKRQLDNSWKIEFET